MLSSLEGFLTLHCFGMFFDFSVHLGVLAFFFELCFCDGCYEMSGSSRGVFGVS